MSINQHQYQNIIYRLTKIEAAIDFVQTRLTNNDLTDNEDNDYISLKEYHMKHIVRVIIDMRILQRHLF